jgi:hypothetical protein
MVKCDTDNALRAELTDLYLDLRELDNISLELQFNGTDVKQYRYWLNHTIGYTVEALEILKSSEQPLDPTENYTDITDLRELTKRVYINYTKTRLAYENEVGDEYGQILNIIGLCLLMTKGYAN